MSDVVDQLDREALNRLDLPKLFESQRGIDRLFLQKILNLAYVVNDPAAALHKINTRTASDILAGGALLTAPISTRYLIFSIRVNYTATATVGTRDISLDRIDKGGIVNRFIADSATASQVRTYEVSPFDTSPATAHRQLVSPLRLEPEWAFRVDDGSNIDNTDDVDWKIELLELPI